MSTSMDHNPPRRRLVGAGPTERRLTEALLAEGRAPQPERPVIAPVDAVRPDPLALLAEAPASPPIAGA